MGIRIWLGLLLCNVAWSFNPTAAKVLIAEVGAPHTALLKYVFAFGAYLFAMPLLRRRGKGGAVLLGMGESRRDLLSVFLIGLATCFVSPMTQMLGLQASTASNSAVLVVFEPLFTVLFGWLILGEAMGRSHLLAFGLALGGFGLLSGLVALDRSALAIGDTIRWGDLGLLVAVAGEAIYSVLARDLIRRYPPAAVFGTAMAFGVALLGLVVLPWKGLPELSTLTLRGLAAALWLGVIGTTIPYLYWLHALSRSASLSSVVLSLFLQPVLGAALGIWVLGERPGPQQLLGALLILSAVGFQVWKENRQPAREPVLLPPNA